MSTFPAEVVDAVCAHMNGDHTEDNLRIVQAFAHPEATAAVMTGLDSDAGVWEVTLSNSNSNSNSNTGSATGTEVRIPWPAAPITERAEIRREVVALHDQACAALGVTPPAH